MNLSLFLELFLKKSMRGILYLLGFCFLLIPPLQAQTYSSEEIFISGVSFSRFSIRLNPDAAFKKHVASLVWLKRLDRNLCWSGTFLIVKSQYEYCRLTNTVVDLELNLSLLGTAAHQMIQMTITDAQGKPLLTQNVSLKNGLISETELIQHINHLSELLTGNPGILGSTLAFTLKRPGFRKIIVRMNTQGENFSVVSKTSSIHLFPRWNPDGTAIIYSGLNREGYAIYYDTLSGIPRPIIKSREITSGGTWFSDGKRLIATLSRNSNVDLYQLDLRRMNWTRLTKHSSIETAPSISPDNRQLLFVSDRTGSEQIYLRSMEEGISYRLTFDGMANSTPSWSPDGKLIVFSKRNGGRSQVYVMDAAGENQRQLTTGNYSAEDPVWSPDGRQLIFSGDKTGVFKLYIMFMDGTGIRRLTHSRWYIEEKSPSWTSRAIKKDL